MHRSHAEKAPSRRTGRPLLSLLLALAATSGLAPAELEAQETIRTEPEEVISVQRGATVVITRPDSIRRVLVADETIAAVSGFPPNQVIVRALSVGTTSLILWGSNDIARIFTIDVTADIASLQRELDELFPDTDLHVRTTGRTVILSGEVRDPSVSRKALELARSLDVPIVDNLQAAPPEQILLEVEFAEVSRSVLKELGTDLLRVLNPEQLDDAFGEGDDKEISTVSEGIVTIMVEGENAQLEGVLRLLKNSGEFRSLAQPNLVTMEGDSASFLAGGEFPFPTIQSGTGTTNAVTIQFKEFGIRLNFRPTVTNAGNIRLQVQPEVSSLDFANGLTFQGFQIPSLVTRRVDTDVELKPGQTLAIGGLLDNSMIEDVDKIPVLGDIPILGFFFRSESVRQNRTELLVLVTPHILDPERLPAPALPTGLPVDWEWDGHIGDWVRSGPDSIGPMIPPADVRPGSGAGGGPP